MPLEDLDSGDYTAMHDGTADSACSSSFPRDCARNSVMQEHLMLTEVQKLLKVMLALLFAISVTTCQVGCLQPQPSLPMLLWKVI